MVSRRGWVAERARQQSQALESAGQLVSYFRRGGRPEPVACSLRLDPGEACYGEGSAGLWQYYGLDSVPYSTRTLIAGTSWGMLGVTAAASAIGNRNRRRRAEQTAAVQWRFVGQLPVVVTSARLLALQHGQWLSWWHSQVRQVLPDPAEMRVTLAFDGSRMTLFEGPFVPWMSVLLVRLLYDDILNLPTTPGLPPGVINGS